MLGTDGGVCHCGFQLRRIGKTLCILECADPDPFGIRFLFGSLRDWIADFVRRLDDGGHQGKIATAANKQRHAV